MAMNSQLLAVVQHIESETITAGLAPDGVYVYAEWGEGRRNRPLSQGEHGCPKQSRTREGKHTRYSKSHSGA